jgi:pyruvate carboxylase
MAEITNADAIHPGWFWPRMPNLAICTESGIKFIGPPEMITVGDKILQSKP